MRHFSLRSFLTLFIASSLLPVSASAAVHKAKSRSRRSVHHRNVSYRAPRSTASRLYSRRRIYSNPYTSPTFADSTIGDSVDGEDLIVRRAAVEALGPYNGSVVVVDPGNGRVLSVVNQKLAFSSGFQPCSTIKLVTTVAGLTEGAITPETTLRIGRRTSFDLDHALARSNNMYFAAIGDRLGFEKIEHYARLMGLGEKAGWNIAAEEPGTLPLEQPKEGMGMMTSFGSGIYLTPLQLAAMVSVFANGGTLFYLQYPRTAEEVGAFQPRAKRQIDLTQYLPDIREGMNDAVEFGTARRANYQASPPIYGKTGTCSDTRTPTHLGWFGSYGQIGERKLVVVVLLTGGHSVSGPVASGIAGHVYRILAGQNYAGQETASAVPLLVTGY